MTRRLFALGIGLGFGLLPLVAAEVPRRAPELSVQLVNGQQLLLSSLRGKVVLLQFMHTTCPHCQQSAVLIQNLYKELGPRGFQPVGIAFNENAAQLVPDFIRQLGISFPVGVAPRDTVIGYLQHPLSKPLYVPQLIFVDRKGVIRAQHGGEDEFLKNLEPNLRAQLGELLKEPAGLQRSRSAKPRSGSSGSRTPKSLR